LTNNSDTTEIDKYDKAIAMGSSAK